MKGFFKIGVVGVGTVLILIAVACVLLMTEADSFFKELIEGAMSYAVNGEVHLDRLRVLPLQESIEIQDLRLHNPPEFKDKEALRIGRVLVEFEGKTLFSRAPIIRRVLLEEAEINLRYKLGKGTNLGALAKAAAERSGMDDSDAPASARRMFEIRELRCENAKISLSANVVPLLSPGVNLASFKLNDFGDRPVRTGEIISIFLRTVLKETLTLKGLLNPVVSLVHKEVDELGGDH